MFSVIFSETPVEMAIVAKPSTLIRKPVVVAKVLFARENSIALKSFVPIKVLEANITFTAAKILFITVRSCVYSNVKPCAVKAV